jgi:putative ABC transport system substrate-binding protein
LLISELAPKRAEFLSAVAPDVKLIGFLNNPANRQITESETIELQHATGALRLRLTRVDASTSSEIESAFAELSRRRIGALLVGGDSFFIAQRDQIASLAARYAIPTIYQDRLNVIAGGLMSYGGNLSEGYRLAGVYAGRILKGQKPAELPVEQATRVELVLNLKTAKALGIVFPNTLLGRADEVIE